MGIHVFRRWRSAELLVVGDTVLEVEAVFYGTRGVLRVDLFGLGDWVRLDGVYGFFVLAFPLKIE